MSYESDGIPFELGGQKYELRIFQPMDITLINVRHYREYGFWDSSTHRIVDDEIDWGDGTAQPTDVKCYVEKLFKMKAFL